MTTKQDRQTRPDPRGTIADAEIDAIDQAVYEAHFEAHCAGVCKKDCEFCEADKERAEQAKGG